MSSIQKFDKNKGNSSESSLKKYEEMYQFSRHDGVIYFITWDVPNIKTFDDLIKVKFGRSKPGSFERRWSAYCHHSTDFPTLIAAISLPNMEHYKLFFPETKNEELPTLSNEEGRAKKHFKDRIYMGLSKEKVKVSVNEVCDYFENRQKQINEMADDYALQFNMWRIPFESQKDNNTHNRIEYFTAIDKGVSEQEALKASII